ncbi:hypothetical protein ACXZ9C_11100 [Streptococcus agalactiae]
MVVVGRRRWHRRVASSSCIVDVVGARGRRRRGSVVGGRDVVGLVGMT